MKNKLHFPAKIYQIIETEDSNIIRWEPCGKAFRIVNHARFEKEVIPKFFRHARIASVQRQLNLYGFKCVNRGEDKGVFCHPNFQRGEYNTVREIRRIATKKEEDDGEEEYHPDNVKCKRSHSTTTYEEFTSPHGKKVKREGLGSSTQAGCEQGMSACSTSTSSVPPQQGMPAPLMPMGGGVAGWVCNTNYCQRNGTCSCPNDGVRPGTVMDNYNVMNDNSGAFCPCIVQTPWGYNTMMPTNSCMSYGHSHGPGSYSPAYTHAQQQIHTQCPNGPPMYYPQQPMGQQMNQIGQQVGQLGQQMGQLGQQMGQMGQQVGQQMGQQMSLPGGVGVGGYQMTHTQQGMLPTCMTEPSPLTSRLGMKWQPPQQQLQLQRQHTHTHTQQHTQPHTQPHTQQRGSPYICSQSQMGPPMRQDGMGMSPAMGSLRDMSPAMGSMGDMQQQPAWMSPLGAHVNMNQPMNMNMNSYKYMHANHNHVHDNDYKYSSGCSQYTHTDSGMGPGQAPGSQMGPLVNVNLTMGDCAHLITPGNPSGPRGRPFSLPPAHSEGKVGKVSEGNDIIHSGEKGGKSSPISGSSGLALQGLQGLQSSVVPFAELRLAAPLSVEAALSSPNTPSSPRSPKRHGGGLGSPASAGSTGSDEFLNALIFGDI